MLNKKMLLPAIAFGVAITFALGGEAKAQWGHGWGGQGYGSGHIGHVQPITRSHFRHGHRSYVPSYGWRAPTFHDTTHLDYHPPQIIRHRRHFHVQPGHYDVHRSGHWHH